MRRLGQAALCGVNGGSGRLAWPCGARVRVARRGGRRAGAVAWHVRPGSSWRAGGAGSARGGGGARGRWRARASVRARATSRRFARRWASRAVARHKGVMVMAKRRRRRSERDTSALGKMREILGYRAHANGLVMTNGSSSGGSKWTAEMRLKSVLPPPIQRVTSAESAATGVCSQLCRV